MKSSIIKANSYVMHTKSGKAYKVTTDTMQSRDRRQVVGTGIRYPEVAHFSENSLHSISLEAAFICSKAERIIRWKKKQSEADKQVLVMYRALRNSIVK